MNIIIAYAASIAYLILILSISELTRHLLGGANEISRKISHIMFSGMWIIWITFAWQSIHLIIMPAIGLILILAGIKINCLKMLERNGSCDYEGIILYIGLLLSISILCYFYNPALIPGTFGIFCVAFGDGTAALVGKKLGKYTPKIGQNKSLAGSLACFFFSLLAMVIICFYFNQPVCLWKLSILAIITTIVELVGGKFDNILIGLSVALCGILLF